MPEKRFICSILIIFLLLTGCNAFKNKDTINSSNNSTEKNNIVLQLESSHFKFYSKKQDKGCLKDLSNELENNYKRVTNDLHTSLDEKINVYIYSDLKSYHEIINQPDAPNWVVGNSNPPDTIYMVNPSKAGSGYSYSDFMKVIVHEFTHIVTAKINPNISSIPRWLTDGIAVYEAKQDDNVNQVISRAKSINKFPKLKDLENPFTFGDDCGYQYSYSIVDYIIKTYGYDKLIALIKSPADFEKILGITEDNFQKKWIFYVK